MTRTTGTATSEETLAKQRARDELFGGLTVTDLAYLFHMDIRSVKLKVGAVKPVGTRRGRSIYQLFDVASKLVKPDQGIEDYLKNARPNDLPPALQKEFWNGLRSKQIFMERDGELWQTDKVMDMLSTIFVTLRMDLLLLPDTLERNSQLSDSQIAVMRAAVDSTLERMKSNLQDQFKDKAWAIAPGIDYAHNNEAPPRDDTFDLEDEEDGFVEAAERDDTFDIDDEDGL